MIYMSGKIEAIIVSILDAICNRKFPAYVSNEECNKLNQIMIINIKVLMKEELSMQSIIMPEHLMSYTGKVNHVRTTSEAEESVMLDNLENLLILQFDECMDEFRDEHASRWEKIKCNPPEITSTTHPKPDELLHNLNIIDQEIADAVRIYEKNKKEIEKQNSILCLSRQNYELEAVRRNAVIEQEKHKQFLDKLNSAKRAPIQKTLGRLVLSDRPVLITRV